MRTPSRRFGAGCVALLLRSANATTGLGSSVQWAKSSSQLDTDKAICFSDRAHEHYLDGIWLPMHEVPELDSYQCTNKLWQLCNFGATSEFYCGAGARFDPARRNQTALPLKFTATSCTLPSRRWT